MQRTHHGRRAANGAKAQAGQQVSRNHSKVDVLARGESGAADEALEQWTVRVVGNVHRCVAMSASFEARQMDREEAQLEALLQARELLIEEESRIRNKIKPPHLSVREREVLALVEQRMSSAAIGRELCISRYTVDTHISRACDVLKVSGRHEAARVALRLGLL